MFYKIYKYIVSDNSTFLYIYIVARFSYSLQQRYFHFLFVNASWIRTLDLRLTSRVFYQGILKGKYHCTVDLLFDWFRISCMATDNFCFYLQNRLIQTSQTGGQWYSDTLPFSIPWFYLCATTAGELYS